MWCPWLVCGCRMRRQLPSAAARLGQHREAEQRQLARGAYSHDKLPRCSEPTMDVESRCRRFVPAGHRYSDAAGIGCEKCRAAGGPAWKTTRQPQMSLERKEKKGGGQVSAIAKRH